jgi:GTP pyrophosphokinase
LASKDPERLIDCAWGKSGASSSYPVEIRVIAADRQGLLRDISDAFSKHKINITAVQTQSSRGEARMLLSAQVDSVAHLNTALASVREVKGVVQAGRR